MISSGKMPEIEVSTINFHGTIRIQTVDRSFKNGNSMVDVLILNKFLIEIFHGVKKKSELTAHYTTLLNKL